MRILKIPLLVEHWYVGVINDMKRDPFSLLTIRVFVWANT